MTSNRAETITVREYDALSNAEQGMMWCDCYLTQTQNLRHRRCYIRAITSKVDGMSTAFIIGPNHRQSILGRRP